MSALSAALDEGRRAFSDLRPVERWLITLFLFVWIATLPVLFHAYSRLNPSPDQSIFDYIAWLASQGLAPYRDSFEVNWPGKILIHWLAQSVFGPEPGAFRTFDYILMQAATLVGAAMLWRNGLRVGAACLLAINPAIYVTSGYWMAGQRDIVAAEILLIACFALAGPRRSQAGLAAAGALMAFAVAIRPTYLAFLAGVLVLEAIWQPSPARVPIRLKAIALIAAGAVSTTLLFVASGLAQSSLGAWYDDSIRYVLDCYASGPPPQSMTGVPVALFFGSWHWIVGGALGGIICWVLRPDLNRFLFMLVLGAMATFALSFIVQKKGFGYHLAGMLPFLVLLFAILVDTLARSASDRAATRPWFGPWHRIARPVLWFALLAVLAVGAAGTAVKLRNNLQADWRSPLPVAMNPVEDDSCESEAAAQSAATYIAASVSPHEYILPVNCGYRAAYLAKRLPASRFATSTAFGDRQRACSLGSRFMDIYTADIRARKPALILVWSKNFDAKAERLSPLGDVSASERRVAQVAKNYQKVAAFGSLLIFKRDADAPAGRR